jgi:hypothetical protein
MFPTLWYLSIQRINLGQTICNSLLHQVGAIRISINAWVR